MSRAKNSKYESMSLEELKANVEKSRQELEAAIHNKNLLEQRKKLVERRERSHRLIVKGAEFEKAFPLSRDLNDFGMDMTATADGETVNMNVALTLLDNGLSIALTTNDGNEEVSMAGSFTQEDGVTITDTEAPTATLLRDVVKNTVAMFYAAQEPVEEETAVTVAE